MNKSIFFNNTAKFAGFVFNKDIFSLSQQIQENRVSEIFEYLTVVRTLRLFFGWRLFTTSLL